MESVGSWGRRARRSFPDGLAGALVTCRAPVCFFSLQLQHPGSYQTVSDIPFRFRGSLVCTWGRTAEMLVPRRAPGVLVARRMARLLCTTYDWL